MCLNPPFHMEASSLRDAMKPPLQTQAPQAARTDWLESGRGRTGRGSRAALSCAALCSAMKDELL